MQAVSEFVRGVLDPPKGIQDPTLFCARSDRSAKRHRHNLLVRNHFPDTRPMLEGSFKAMNLMTLLQSCAVSGTGTPMVVRVFEVSHMVGAVWLDGNQVLGCAADGGLIFGADAFLSLYNSSGVGGFRVYQMQADPFADIDSKGLEASGPLPTSCHHRQPPRPRFRWSAKAWQRWPSK